MANTRAIIEISAKYFGYEIKDIGYTYLDGRSAITEYVRGTRKVRVYYNVRNAVIDAGYEVNRQHRNISGRDKKAQIIAVLEAPAGSTLAQVKAEIAEATS